MGVLISDSIDTNVPTIHVTAYKNSPDIARYIESSIRGSSVLRRVSNTLRAEIVETLSTGARGMFLWVDLILHELNRNRGGTEAGMRRILNSAPADLTKMLRHVLQGFSSGDSTEDEVVNLNEILAWVACAKRPLTLGELDAVLKLRDSDGQGMIYLEGALRKQFASFFTLAREDGLSTSELQFVRQIDSDIELSGAEDGETNQIEGLVDLESATDFESNPSTTEVTFCHASIGQFFRDEREHKISAGQAFPFVGVEYSEAKVSVLKTCLEIFCDGTIAQRVGVGHSILIYAGDNWLEHLTDIDISMVSTTQKRELAILLCRMVQDDTKMDLWVGRLGPHFFIPEHVKLIRAWLTQEDIVTLLPEKTQKWVQATAKNPATIFSEVARRFAHQWLEGLMWSPLKCCVPIHWYMMLEKGVPLTSESIWNHTAQDIIDVARWATLEESALWHRRLAMALRDGVFFDEAIEHFSSALEIDTIRWLARAGMAITFTLKKEFTKALELDRITEQELLESTGKEQALHNVQQRMGESYSSSGDEQNAFLNYQRGFRNAPWCDTCICACLTFLHENKRYADIIDMLKLMDTLEIPSLRRNSLMASLINNYWSTEDYFRIVTKTALETQDLVFLIRSYRSAIKQAKKDLKPVVAGFLELCLATLYYDHVKDQHRAIKSWERVLDTFTGSSVDIQITYLRLEASTKLAGHWFRKAVEAGVGTPEAEQNIERLEKIASRKRRTHPGEKEDRSYIGANVISLLIGVWHRLTGREADARAYIQPSMKQAIQLLTDDDLENDSEGWSTLCTTLVAASDDENAIATAHYLGYYGEEDKEQNILGTCDGSCQRQFPNFDNISMCRYCFNIGFCDDCLTLLKEARMPLDVCSPKHDFLRIPHATHDKEENVIVVNGKPMPLENWKAKLKAEWRV